MAYAVKQDIIDRYGEDILLTSFDPDNTGSADDDLITKALADASSEVDSYLAALYDVPLATTPDIIVQRTVDIGVYLGSFRADVMTDGKRQRYEDAVAWLKLVAKGTIQLGLEAEPATKAGGAAVSNSALRRFTRDTMDGL